MLTFVKLLRPFRLSIATVLVLMLAQSLAQLALPAMMADIVDTGIVQGHIRYILGKGGWMLVFVAGSSCCIVLASALASKTSVGFGKFLRNKLFEQVHRLDYSGLEKFGTASLIARTTHDIAHLQQTLFMLLRIFSMSPMMLIGGMAMAFYANSALSVILILALPLLIGIVAIITHKGLPLFNQMQIYVDRLHLVMRENLTGIRTIRAFSQNEYESKRFQAVNAGLTEQSIRANQLLAVLMPAMLLIMNFSIIAIMWYGGKQIDRMEMQVGSLMAFIQYAMQVLLSLSLFSVMFSVIPRAVVSARRVLEVMNSEAEVDVGTLSTRLNPNLEKLKVEHVTFRYAGAEQPVLLDVSFEANVGEITAIIGSTGSGKSTLAGLLARLHDPEKGRVLWNGVDIREAERKRLRGMIGYVSQKPVLFSGSIADNILLGKENASDDEVIQAAEMAQATEFIDLMPDRMESMVAQGGANLSGGQKQRLAIARAFVRKPAIYILDNCFSALDYRTSSKLQEVLRKEASASIVLLVADHIQAVRRADRIIVLDEGRVSAIGTHEQLLENCEVYRELAVSQHYKGEIV